MPVGTPKRACVTLFHLVSAALLQLRKIPPASWRSEKNYEPLAPSPLPQIICDLPCVTTLDMANPLPDDHLTPELALDAYFAEFEVDPSQSQSQPRSIGSLAEQYALSQVCPHPTPRPPAFHFNEHHDWSPHFCLTSADVSPLFLRPSLDVSCRPFPSSSWMTPTGRLRSTCRSHCSTRTPCLEDLHNLHRLLCNVKIRSSLDTSFQCMKVALDGKAPRWGFVGRVCGLSTLEKENSQRLTEAFEMGFQGSATLICQSC
jgi:hypothetical protein